MTGMEYKDYYAVLGVPRTASQAEIKKAFRKLARQHHPDAKPGDTAAERRFKEVNEANEVLGDPDKRKQYDELGANWEQISRARAAAGAAGAGPFGAYGGPGGNVRYEFRTSGDPGEFSDFFRVFFGEDVDGDVRRTTSGPGRGTRPTGGPGLRGHPGRDGPRVATGLAGAATGTQGRARPAPRPAAEAHAEISLAEAYHGHDPRGRGRRQAARGQDPAGRRHRDPDPPDRQGAGRRRPVRGRPPAAGRPVHAPRRRPRARAAAHARGGAPWRRGQGGDAQGQRPAQDPGRHPGRADVPADRPGHAPVQGQRPRRPVRQGQGRPANRPVRRGEGRGPRASSTSSTNPIRADARRASITRETTCNSNASPRRPRRRSSPPRPPPSGSRARCSTPSTSSPRSSSPMTACPAETLRRLGVDLPGFRGELAAILAKRARIQGGSLTLDPRARRVIESRRGGGEAARRRVRLDRAPAPRHRRGRRRGAGPARAACRRPRGDPPGAPERPRRPAGHLARTRRAPTPRSRSTGATSPPRPAPASSIR